MRKIIFGNKIIASLYVALLLSCKIDPSSLQNHPSEPGPIACLAIAPVQDQLKFTSLDKSKFYRIWLGDYTLWSNCNPELDHMNDDRYRELTDSEVLFTTYIADKTQIVFASYNSSTCENEPHVLLRAQINIQTQEIEKKISVCYYGIPKYFEFEIPTLVDQHQN